MKLIVFSGPPCSGKSFIGARLARIHGLAHYEMDVLRARLLPESRHTREDRAVAYRAMHYVAEEMLRAGMSVIVNAGYSHDVDRGEAAAVASRTGAEMYLVEFTVPLDVALERNRARRDRHPGLDLTDERVAEIAGRFPYTRAGLLIDSTGDPELCVREIERYVFSTASNLPSGNR